jgi:FKBP-type peptidyl-prolyl cis-trans isomerase
MRITLIAVLGAMALNATACHKNEEKVDKKAADNAKAVDQAAGKAGDNLKDARKPPAPMPDIPAPPDVAAPPADAKKTEKGVSYKVLSPGAGDGKRPTPNDTVEVEYTGWTTDGKMFDSSKKRGRPAEFPLSRVIPGWTDGLQVMSVGEETRFWIPEDLAYKGKPNAPQGMLVFDVKLLSIKAAPPVPEDVAAPPKDVKKTKKGVSYKMLAPAGTGKKPRAWDKVKVNYTGWTTDGKMFDSSVTRGTPAEFSLSGVVEGWTEGLQQMGVGDKARLWIPQELAYKGKPGAPAGMLVFDVELIEVTEMPEPPKTPEDVAAPPKDAKKTEKGVFYKVLKKGTGTQHPTATSRVEVHYSGWTTDGKMFDSSVTRGKPITFGLDGVIPGWTDGVQTMVVGEKTRMWIPAALAYEGKPNRPQGMLVFDIELLKIE